MAYKDPSVAGRMNDEQMERIKDHFLLFDKDGSGFITTDELGLTLRSLGFHVEEKHLKDLIEEFDQNKDGKLDFNEFYNIITTRMKNPLTEDELKEAFHIFDKDNNGKITVSELKIALTSFGEKLTDQEVEEFIEDIDTNGDGELDIKELTRFLIRQK